MSAESAVESKAIIQRDKALHREFDTIVRKSKPKKIRVKLKAQRPRGRPKTGRVVFDEKIIALLPELAHLSEVARVLDVKHTSLQQWCDQKLNPLPCVPRDGHRWFRRDVLVKWLIATKRYHIKKKHRKV